MTVDRWKKFLQCTDWKF